MQKMTIEIEFGNAAMLTVDDAWGMLEAHARDINRDGGNPWRESLLDVNGNTVGRVAFTYHNHGDE